MRANCGIVLSLAVVLLAATALHAQLIGFPLSGGNTNVALFDLDSSKSEILVVRLLKQRNKTKNRKSARRFAAARPQSDITTRQ
jgi:hypothetical protein